MGVPRRFSEVFRAFPQFSAALVRKDSLFRSHVLVSLHYFYKCVCVSVCPCEGSWWAKSALLVCVCVRVAPPQSLHPAVVDSGV